MQKVISKYTSNFGIVTVLLTEVMIFLFTYVTGEMTAGPNESGASSTTVLNDSYELRDLGAYQTYN